MDPLAEEFDFKKHGKLVGIFLLFFIAYLFLTAYEYGMLDSNAYGYVLLIVAIIIMGAWILMDISKRIKGKPKVSGIL